MKLKKKIQISLTIVMVVFSLLNTTGVRASEIVSNGSNIGVLTYEDTHSLPYANLNRDLIGKNNGVNLFNTRSVKNPSSISDYKKLGYKNIQYTKWTGHKNVASTKSKRIATFIVTNILGITIPGKAIKGVTYLYDLSNAVKTQNPDIWPTSNTRRIFASAPGNGARVIIGEEVIIKYYGNSSRTKLLKTIHKTYWIN